MNKKTATSKKSSSSPFVSVSVGAKSKKTRFKQKRKKSSFINKHGLQKVKVLQSSSATSSHHTVKSPAVMSPVTIPSIAEGGSILQNYLATIAKIPLLSSKQEYDLAVAYFETKDPEIARTLIQSNLRFVVKVVAEYSKFSSKVMDLIQEGNIGLVRAVKEFNPYKGARLITYAVWWIRGYIQEYLMRHHSVVRLGSNKKQQRLFYLLQKENKKVSEEESMRLLPSLAKQSGNSLQDVEKMKEIVLKKDFHLDRPIGEYNGDKFIDIQADPKNRLYDELSLKQISQKLRLHLKDMRFSDKEKKIIQDRLLRDPPLTLQEIANHFSVSREAIRQTSDRLMIKLKKKFIPLLKKHY